MWRQRTLRAAAAGAGAGALAAAAVAASAAAALWPWSKMSASTPAGGTALPVAARTRGEDQVSAAATSATAAPDVVDDADLRLKQVQIFFRHGARTPINIIPNVKEARYDSDIFMRPLSFMNYELPIVDLDGNAKSGTATGNLHYSRVLEGGSRVGQLTTYGMQQSYELGLRLRRRYVDEMRFLDVSSEGFNPDNLYVRSTFIVRTMLTAKAVLAGLLDPTVLKTQENTDKPRLALHVTDHVNELLYPNTALCPCLHDIVHHGLDNLHEVPGLDRLRKRVFTIVGYEDGLNGTHGHKHLQLTEFRDDLVARMTHGLPVPVELRPFSDDIDRYGTVSCLHGLIGSTSNQSVGLRLATGPLVHNILSNMDGSLDDASPKFHLYAVHDSTIMPLLTAMNVFDGKWPPFCSELTFELYTRSGSSTGSSSSSALDEPVVKVRYMGQDLRLPGCTGAACTLSKFKELLSHVSIVPEERRRLCHSAPAPPPTPSPPPEQAAPESSAPTADTSADGEEEVELATGM